MKTLNNRFDKKEKIIKEYNKTSQFYDNRYGEIQKGKFRFILQSFNLFNKIILDAGCGTGLIIEYITGSLKQKDKTWYLYVGIDISWNMLKIFKSKINSLDLKKNHNLILSDIENIPLRKDKFDLIFSFTSLQNLPNIEKGTKYLWNVGKNSARINLSILKKNIKINDILKNLKQKIKISKIIDDKNLEDIIIFGEIIKR